jgi:hypothetical protein
MLKCERYMSVIASINQFPFTSLETKMKILIVRFPQIKFANFITFVMKQNCIASLFVYFGLSTSLWNGFGRCCCISFAHFRFFTLNLQCFVYTIPALFIATIFIRRTHTEYRYLLVIHERLVRYLRKTK